MLQTFFGTLPQIFINLQKNLKFGESQEVWILSECTVQLYWLYTHTHTIRIYAAATPFIIYPNAYSPYPYHFITAHCKYGIETDPVYCILLSRVLLISYFYFSIVFVLPCVIFSATLILMTALLGLELARKAFHYTSACDIKTWKWIE
jgi:hypothetical protein